VGPKISWSKEDFQHFCKQLYLYFCFGSTHVFLLCRYQNISIEQGLQTFSSEDHKSCYTTVRGPDILRNVIASGYVTFYQIKKFLSVNFSLFTKCIRGPHLARRP